MSIIVHLIGDILDKNSFFLQHSFIKLHVLKYLNTLIIICIFIKKFHTGCRWNNITYYIISKKKFYRPYALILLIIFNVNIL